MLEEIKRLKSIADIGLLYSSDAYDRERYLEVQQLSLQLANQITGESIEKLKLSLPTPQDYPTAKVDIRGMVLSADQKILLVKEQADGRWSLPGGWADVGYSPTEVIIKELKEETGLDAIPQRLLAIFDKRLHAHPPQAFYVYKLVFYCKAVSATIHKGFDVLDVQYFDSTQLPELSEDRILKTQINMLYEKIISADNTTYFD